MYVIHAVPQRKSAENLNLFLNVVRIFSKSGYAFIAAMCPLVETMQERKDGVKDMKNCVEYNIF